MRRRPAADLFDQVASFPALLAATRRAAQGKRERPDAAAFLFRLEPNLLRLSDALYSGQWQPGGYRKVMVREPKTRHISIAPFADRVVHQALHGVLGPLTQRSFISDSFASLPGRGQHRAIARYEQFRDTHPWVLRCDIHRFFPSIDHAVAKHEVRRWVACPRTLAVVDAIIDGSNPQEPVNAYFPGDDLFTPWERRRGLPLGNLTSQWLANLVLNPLDHWVKEVLRLPGYLRYLDDFALFCHSADEALDLQRQVQGFLDRRRLRLHPIKTQALCTCHPATFLGLELWPDRHRRLPQANVSRAAERVRRARLDWTRGLRDEAEVRRTVAAWVAHARHADTFLLRRRWFSAGWFDPEGETRRARTRPRPR
ncbi:RNA-directed DNA polymerase [Pseudaquabacterium rugosum]|uniref:RNA-directed DNA polymerase n=1 Tax=Pseudaquabacterium rugosum TaxID=2984194 RepID=A0ABU9BAX9_9BURK